MNLYVVYGSEASLLKNIYTNDNYYLRIYNTSAPLHAPNCLDVPVGEISSLGQLLKKITKTTVFEKIIFIGAGFFSENKIFVQLSSDDLKKSVQTNIVNYLEILQILIKNTPLKIEKVFIYLSSFRSKNPTTGTSLYSASKAYGEILFISLAKEYGRMNLRTVIIRMGYFEGRMLEIFDPEESEATLKKIALKRFGSSEELAKAIEFGISNTYLSGGAIDIDGGISYD